MSDLMVPCYQSTTRQYRHEMAGSPEATSLPKADGGEGISAWGTAQTEFEKMMTDIDDGLRAAEAAHEGRAADAANASIEEIKPHMDRAAQASGEIQTGLEQQVNYQSRAFDALPSEGEKLESGRDVQLDPPEKGWVEKAGLDNNPITGWMSDYEDRQEDFRATNERAVTAMERYKSQTESNLEQLPKFEEQKQAPPPNQPAPGTGMNDAGAQMAGSGYSSTPSMGGGGSAAPAGSSSSWASAPSAGGSSPGAPGVGAPSTPAQPPAGTAPSWAPGGGSSLPPGVVRGPDGTLYRQTPGGGWERQNPYNGRWAPVPGGAAGGARAAAGAGGAGAGGTGAGGAAAARSGGGAANQMGAGGRAGVGGMSGSSGGATAGGATTSAGGSGGRGGAPMGGAGARGGQGGAEEEEHERPSWLVETEDVFTNDMQRVAPPVLGETPGR